MKKVKNRLRKIDCIQIAYIYLFLAILIIFVGFLTGVSSVDFASKLVFFGFQFLVTAFLVFIFSKIGLLKSKWQCLLWGLYGSVMSFWIAFYPKSFPTGLFIIISSIIVLTYLYWPVSKKTSV